MKFSLCYVVENTTYLIDCLQIHRQHANQLRMPRRVQVKWVDNLRVIHGRRQLAWVSRTVRNFKLAMQ